MESDIKSAQSGQAPKSIEVKPSIIPAIPKEIDKLPVLPPSQSKITLPLLPVPSQPKSVLSPPPSLADVKLGEDEKRTTPLPGQIIPKPEPKPQEIKPIPSPIPSRPLLSPIPPAPLSRPVPGLPPVPSKPATAPAGLAIPPRPSFFGNKKMLAIGALAILFLAGGFLYWRGNAEPEVAVSPTPTVSEIVSSAPGLPKTSTLTAVFGDGQSLSFSSADQAYGLSNLRNELDNLSNNSSKINLLIEAKDASKGNISFKFSEFLGKFSIIFPANLVSYVDNNDFNLILTKQTEFFDQNGVMIASPSAEQLLTPKMALAVRVIDALEANQQLTFWESTIADNLRDFYRLPFPSDDLSFSDSAYNGVKIRYVNFSYPDQALDYATISARNGNDYLIIANSRQQMYSIIDQLLGF